MSEEIKFLREHIEGICAYKGLQRELTYDVSLEILKRVCIALDFLELENQSLKRNCNIGNENLTFYREEYTKLKDRINKAIEYIEEVQNFPHTNINQHKDMKELKEILKGDNNE